MRRKVKKNIIVLLGGDYQLDQEIQAALGEEFRVIKQTSRPQLMDSLTKDSIDLILMDMSLQDVNGFDLLQELKSHARWNQIPVIVLSNIVSIADKVRGLSLGADDYLVHPLDPLELRARVESRLRFSRQKSTQEKMFKRGRFELDPSRGRFFVTEAGAKKEISLTPYEFRLLTLFLEREGHILSRDQLMKDVWGENTYVLPRTVDRHISALRSKIDTRWGHLDTVHGVGYRFALSNF